MGTRINKNSKRKRPPETIEEWAEQKDYLKWPLICIIMVVCMVVVLISITTPNQ